jgi:Fur family ferric uptake transcriptional regulator
MQVKNYNTKQRDFLVNFFKSNAGGCFTVEEVLTHAINSGSNIGQTTIYRNLEKLAGEGILIKYNMPNGSGAYFQYSDCKNDDGHCHLLCTACGGITHLECDYVKKLSSHILEEHKFNFDRQKTVFYGLCEKCSAES